MKPYILITNDDGISSPGLLAAAEAVQGLGELIIAAPYRQQTGMGRSFPESEDAGIIEAKTVRINGTEIPAFGVHGSPAQAVAYAVLELCPVRPALCISGINYGENLGLSNTCSGTLGAAFEANSHRIFSIAASLEAELSHQKSEEFNHPDWTASKQVIRTFAQKALNRQYGEAEIIWNINIPGSADKKTEYRWTRQSRQNYSEFLKPPNRDFGKRFDLRSEIRIDADIEKDSDIYAFYFDKVISVTPLTWNLSVEHRDK